MTIWQKIMQDFHVFMVNLMHGSILVHGNGDVCYTEVLEFKDISSDEHGMCIVRYDYSIEQSIVKNICSEFLYSGFFTKTFNEERSQIVDAGPQRGFSITINGQKFEKIFTDPMPPEVQKIFDEIERSKRKPGEKVNRVDGMRIPKELQNLQTLFDQVIRERERTGKIGTGSVYVFGKLKSGIYPVDLKQK